MENQLRVLCVDDNDSCDLLSATLGFLNIAVESAGSVAEALRLAQTESFDSYLLETKLPDGEGFKLCRHLAQANQADWFF